MVLLFKDGRLRLAYEINVGNSETNILEIETIDAITGELLQSEPTIYTFFDNRKNIPPPNAPGTAATLYSGMQNFTTDTWQGQFRLQELRNAVTITTQNANHQWNTETIVNTATDIF